MNFLAHLLLAPADPESKLGSILPDLTRGPLHPENYPPRVLDAAAQHRRIDRFTDTHPQFITSRNRLTSLRPRLRGIVADVLYDHFLSVNWAQYSDEDLPTFIASTYDKLQTMTSVAPPATASIIQRMIEQDWLSAYIHDAGLVIIFNLMSRRLSHRVRQTIDLTPAVNDLKTHRDTLSGDFAAFFPDLVRTQPAHYP